MSGRLRGALALLCLACTMFVAAPPASALSWGGRDPVRNVSPIPYISGSVCDATPFSTACRLRLIAALQSARRRTGLPAYTLPDRFIYLSQREKLLVLANQERLTNGLSALRGMNVWLNRSAQAGVLRRDDPYPVNYLAGQHWSLWTANWAGGNGSFSNPVTAHYDWMYYDGLNSNGTSWNLACHTWDQTLCWKHRHNILVRLGSWQQLAIGIGAGPDGHGWTGFTQLLESFPASAPIAYIPTVTRVSSRWSPAVGGKVVTLGGFGFSHVLGVTVLGRPARVLHVDTWHLTIRAPAGARGSAGYIVVHTSGGYSSRNLAAGFHYGT